MSNSATNAAVEMMPETALASEEAPKLSVIVTVDGDAGGLEALMDGYLQALAELEVDHEVLCFYDHMSTSIAEALERSAAKWDRLQPIAQRPWIGEDSALKTAIGRARGSLILTLPGWQEIEPGEIATLYNALGSDDMVTARRGTAPGSGWQKLRRGLVHGLIHRLFGKRFEDVFCRVRLGRAEVFREIADVGVRQHFLPVLATAEGFRLSEVTVKAAATTPYNFKPLGHLSALTDILSLYVALKFLRRPLRFFGAVGLPLFLLGVLITGALIFMRLVMGEPLADRPALVFGVLMMVLGLQIIALGLIGEIVIFSSTRRMKTYAIERVIRGDPPS